MKIAFLVCDNGFGHIKRCLLIAYYLSSKGFSVDLYGNEKGFKIANSLEIKFKNHPNLIPWNFSYKIKYFLSNSCKKLKIIEKIPPLEIYDLVFSDNILEVLLLRQDTIFISQFFWHEVLKDIDNDYRKKCREIIKKFKPIILGDQYFSMDYIKNSKNYISTGLFSLGIQKENSEENSHNRKDLLITIGNTNQSCDLIKNLINKIKNEKNLFFNNLYLEDCLIPKNPPSWIKSFNYTQTQLKNIKACICRPGLGIISDCIEYKIRIYSIFEEKNLEMEHNSFVIKRLGIGEKIINNDLTHIKNYFITPSSEAKVSSKIMDFNLSGVYDVYNFIKDNYT